MTTILIVAILVIAAFLVVIWALGSMLRYKCPECSQTEDGIVIPVLPGVFWWCPGCNQTFKKPELVDKEDQL